MFHLKFLLLALCLLFGADSFAQKKMEMPESEQKWEMKEYYFVMLSKGEKRGTITDTATINKLQMAHLDNINRLAEEGKILVAGPFGDNGNWRGIFIFDAKNKEEVEQHLNTDPMIAAGWLAYEIHPWWTAKNCVFK